MSVKVAKFGGSSLAESRQIQKVRRIIEADAQRRYIVASAPGKRFAHDQKVTDMLYLCHEHAWQELDFDELFDRITERFVTLGRELGTRVDLDKPLGAIKSEISRQALAGLGPDYAASRGEALNAQLLADLLGAQYIDAAEVIFFDHAGRLDSERTYQRLEKRLIGQLGERGRAVIPGFYGSLPDGSIKTFGRGGSDVSGSIIARAVHAAVYENWTDVSGLRMTDPTIVPEARKIETITYRELRELSYSGARVLHDEAVFPVREAGIPVHVRNTNAPDDPGTTIVADRPDLSARARPTPGPSAGSPPPTPDQSTAAPTALTALSGVDVPAITGLAGRRDFTVINIEKAMMNSELGFGRRVLNVLEGFGIRFEHMPSGIDTLSVVIDDDQLGGNLEPALEQLESECQPDKIDVDADLALIATVGRGMAHTPGMAARLFAALGQAQVNIRMIDQGSSELNIIVGVDVDDYEKAVRAIYHAFVG